MEKLRAPGGVLAVLALVLTVVFAVLGKLAVIPAVLIGMVALALLL